MVTRDTAWAPGTPCWVDLGVADIPKADTFYSSLFGWEIFDTGPEGGGYRMCSIGGRPVAGIGAKSEPDIGTFWTTYLASADADETAAKIKAAGGQVVVEPFDVMDVGRMLIAVDPGGAMFGVWQARSHTGMQVANEPGSVTWNENMSRQFDNNKAFYGSVFGYGFGDIGAEGMEYETLDLDGSSVGGIGGIGPEQPAEALPRWITYFAVADADAALARVAELGGTVIAPAWDTPYGRMGFAQDDQGAEFAVMAPPAAAEG